MFRINTPGATPDHRFTEGDPFQGILPTRLSQDWLESVQKEIAHVIEHTGMSLDPQDSKQLLKAILKISQLSGLDLRLNLPRCFEIPAGPEGPGGEGLEAKPTGLFLTLNPNRILARIKGVFFRQPNDSLLPFSENLMETFYFDSEEPLKWSHEKLFRDEGLDLPKFFPFHFFVSNQGEIFFKKQFESHPGTLWIYEVKEYLKTQNNPIPQGVF